MSKLICINLFLLINPIIVDNRLRNIVLYLRNLKICRLKIPSANTEISVISLRDAEEGKDDVDIARASRYSRVIRDSSRSGIVQGVLRDKKLIIFIFSAKKKYLLSQT